MTRRKPLSMDWPASTLEIVDPAPPFPDRATFIAPDGTKWHMVAVKAKNVEVGIAELNAAIGAWRAARMWVCDWVPDDLNPGPDCPYCAGEMCARFDGLGCTHDRIERHGYTIERYRSSSLRGTSRKPVR